MTKRSYVHHAVWTPIVILGVALVGAAVARLVDRVIGGDLTEAIGWADLVLFVTTIATIGYIPFGLLVAWWASRRDQPLPRTVVWLSPIAIAIVLTGLTALMNVVTRHGAKVAPALFWGGCSIVVGYVYVIIADLTYRLRR